MDAAVEALKLSTSGLLVDSPRELCSVHISGCIDKLVASLVVSYRFGVQECDEEDNTHNESVFRLIWPDFGSTIFSFDAVVDGESFQSSITDSSNNSTKFYRSATSGSATNEFTAIIRDLPKTSTVELKIGFTSLVQYVGTQLLLKIPVLLLSHLILDTSTKQALTSGRYRPFKSDVFLHVDILVQSASRATKITSPTHPITVVPMSKGNNAINKSSSDVDDNLGLDSVFRIMLASSTETTALSLANAFNLSLSLDPKDQTSVAPQFEAYKSENKEISTVLLPFRPSLPVVRASAEVQLVIDSYHMNVLEILRSVRNVVRNETFSSIWLNLVLITKLGPQFAFPRPTTLSPEATEKLLRTLDTWDKSIINQGHRTQNTSFLKSALSTVVRRFTPQSDLPKHVILLGKFTSSGDSLVDSLLPVINDVSVFPITIGLDADFFASKDLATSTNGRSEMAYTISALEPTIKIQLQRCIQPQISNIRLTLSLPEKATESGLRGSGVSKSSTLSNVVIAPENSAAFFVNDLLCYFAFFDKDTLDEIGDQTIKAELSGEWEPNNSKTTAKIAFEGGSILFQFPRQSCTSTPHHIAKYGVYDHPITLLGLEEHIMDQESCGKSDSFLSTSVGSFPVLGFTRNFSYEAELSKGGSIALFNLSEKQCLELTLGAGDAALKVTPAQDRVKFDADVLLKQKPPVAIKPLSLGNFSPRASADSGPSTPPGSSGRKGSDSYKRRHGLGNSSPKVKVRPVLTIQGVWADARLDATASKPMTHYQQWFKAMNSTLNKLTDENYERLSTKILTEIQAEIADPFSVKGVTGLIYDKAVRQRTYAAMYAELIRRLVAETSNVTDLIRRSLLDKVRSEFEIAITPKELLHTLASTTTGNGESTTSSTSLESPRASPSVPDLSTPSNAANGASSTTEDKSGTAATGPQRPRFFNSKLGASSPAIMKPSELSKSEQNRINAYTEDEEEKENKAREFRVGLVVFLGQLFQKGIVSVDIAQHCIGELMSKALQYQTTYQTKSAECLTLATKYIEVIGKYLQKENSAVVEKLFASIDTEILENPALENRNRILFTNLIELKNNNWVPRDPLAEEAEGKASIIRRSSGYGYR